MQEFRGNVHPDPCRPLGGQLGETLAMLRIY
jgi:hypothetical protein